MSENKFLFYDSLPHPLLVFVILFVQVASPPISCWNSDFYIASFPFILSRYNIYPIIEHSAFFNSSPNFSNLLDIND